MMSSSLHEFKAGIFQALAHPSRVAIAEVLREGEFSTSEILERVGIEQSNASVHLAIMKTKGVVVSRKDGKRVFYSLRHPMLGDVLDIMRQYFMTHLSEANELLQVMASEDRSLEV